MTNAHAAPDPGPLPQLREAAASLIARLNDRAAYAPPDEFDEIRIIVRALRQICQIPLREQRTNGNP